MYVRTIGLAAILTVALTPAITFAQGASSRPARPAKNVEKPAPARPATSAKKAEKIAPAVAPGKISFKAENSTWKAQGTFKRWSFTKIDIPEGDYSKGTVEITIDTGSIESNADGLTKHMKADDFFDAVKFPVAKVSIKNAKPTDKTAEGLQNYEADGTVTIRGISAPVKFNFTRLSETPLKVKGNATLDRDQFGIYTASDPSNPKSPTKMVPIEFETVIPSSISVEEAAKAMKKEFNNAGKAMKEAAKKTGNEGMAAGEDMQKKADEMKKGLLAPR